MVGDGRLGIDAEGGADHVRNRLGFHLDDAPAGRPVSRLGFVEPDVSKLMDGGLKTLRPGKAGANDHISPPPVREAVGLAEEVKVGDLEAEPGVADQLGDLGPVCGKFPLHRGGAHLG